MTVVEKHEKKQGETVCGPENLEEMYLFRLCSISGLGVAHLLPLYRIFGSAEAVFRASESELSELSFLRERDRKLLLSAREDVAWKEEWREVEKKHIAAITYFHPNYPEALRQLFQPPKKLLVKGRLPDEKKLSIAIVGARDCTAYGRDMARMFGYRLAENGVQVISGMARGIDGWGHQGALESGGDTYAVLGSGVEVCYPAVHQGLYRSIQKHGGVISEYSIHEKAFPAYFPMRNRIISALSDGILVVEARAKSGSLITADAALEQGRDVFVVPGRIGDELSVGCNRLIRQGAVPVLSPEDILTYYGVQMHKKETKIQGVEAELLAHMPGTPIHADELTKLLKISPTEVQKGLLKLKKKGMVEEVARELYMKKL